MLRWPAIRWPRLASRRGVREAALACAIATLVLLLLTVEGGGLVRGLETASLDLRFRLRGPIQADAHTAVVLVDDKSLAALGSWPLSRRFFAKAVDVLGQAGARVIAFDLLFAEPEEPVSA